MAYRPFLGERKVQVVFSNINSTKFKEMNNMSVSGLGCGGCLLCLFQEAVGTDHLSEMFDFCYSLQHYFTQSFGYVSSLYHFLMKMRKCCIFLILNLKVNGKMPQTMEI